MGPEGLNVVISLQTGFDSSHYHGNFSQQSPQWENLGVISIFMEWLSKARTYRAYARTKGAGGFSRLPLGAPKHPKTPPPRPPNYHIGSEKGVRSNEFNVCCMQIKINRIKLNKIILISKSKQSLLSLKKEVGVGMDGLCR